MTELIATIATTEPNIFQKFMLVIFAWITGLGMILGSLGLLVILVLVIVGSSYD
jgi:hypothetical protein